MKHKKNAKPVEIYSLRLLAMAMNGDNTMAASKQQQKERFCLTFN